MGGQLHAGDLIFSIKLYTHLGNERLKLNRFKWHFKGIYTIWDYCYRLASFVWIHSSAPFVWDVSVWSDEDFTADSPTWSWKKNTRQQSVSVSLSQVIHKIWVYKSCSPLHCTPSLVHPKAHWHWSSRSWLTCSSAHNRWFSAPSQLWASPPFGWGCSSPPPAPWLALHWRALTDL